MNVIDLILLAVLAVIVFFALRKTIRSKGSCNCGCSGSGGCSGNCASCGCGKADCPSHKQEKTKM